MFSHLRDDEPGLGIPQDAEPGHGMMSQVTEGAFAHHPGPRVDEAFELGLIIMLWLKPAQDTGAVQLMAGQQQQLWGRLSAPTFLSFKNAQELDLSSSRMIFLMVPTTPPTVTAISIISCHGPLPPKNNQHHESNDNVGACRNPST